jgi:CBS domain containing-hemolysin-like protein
MFLLIVYVLIALCTSFLCSILEAVLLSVTASFATAYKSDNPKVGEQLVKMKRNPDRPLSAILTLNTIAHTFGAAGAGAQAQKVWGEEWLTVFSAVLTLAILVITEIIPKTIGAVFWRRLAGPATRVLRILTLSLYPFVVLSELLTRMIGGKSGHPTMSREEIAALAQVGQEAGVLDEEEGRLFRNLMRFRSLRAKDIMTPRVVMITRKATMPVHEFTEDEKVGRFSRIPIWEERSDNVIGYVLRSEILAAAARDEHKVPVGEFIKPIIVVEEDMRLQPLFSSLIQKREHIALVVDEYGGVAGLATLEDVIETLIGMEIVDEHDRVEDMQVLAREAWRKRARELGLPVDEQIDETVEESLSSNKDHANDTPDTADERTARDQ